MAKQIPNNFQTTASTLIASYDWQDIISGLGYEEFFLSFSSDSAGDNFGLITSSLYSSVLETTRAGAGTTEQNFDTSTFNAPRTVKGTAYLQVPVRGVDASGIQIIAQIIVVDAAATETTISSEIDDTVTFSAAGGTLANQIILLKIPLTETLVKIGEKIRVELQNVTTNASVSGYAHDPGNRTSSLYDITTVSKLALPFKLDPSAT